MIGYSHENTLVIDTVPDSNNERDKGHSPQKLKPMYHRQTMPAEISIEQLVALFIQNKNIIGSKFEP